MNGRQPVDLVIEAGLVVPVEPHATVLHGHALVVDAGRIVALVPRADARARYAPRERVERPHHVLLPGLVNAHVHNPMTLMRGIADDVPLHQWLQQHIWPAEARVMGPAFVRDGVELAVAEMVRGGTTCCNENYFFPDAIAATYKRLGFRAMVGLPLIDFPSAWASDADAYFERGLAVHDDYRRDPMLRTAFAPHAPYTVGDDSFARVRTLADQLDIPVHLHVHETAQEVEDAKRDHGMRPLQRLQKLGLVNRQLIAVHMTQLTEAEIALCAEQGVSIVHCPESNLKLASGFCPAAALVRAGATVALGTDGCASNNDLDMFGEMRTAALLAKGVARDASAFDAATTLRAATLGGACAMGWDEHIGSLVAGKAADVIAVSLDDIESTPFYDVVSQLVYAGNRRQVTDVWIAGHRKLADGVLVDQDVAELRERARHWQRQLASAS